MKNNIRIAIVGTGYFSQFHFDAWRRLKVKVVAICSLNENDAIYYSNKFNNCPISLGKDVSLLLNRFSSFRLFRSKISLGTELRFLLSASNVLIGINFNKLLKNLLTHR